MIWAQAQKIIQVVGTIVRRAQRAYVSGLGIGSRKAQEALAAHLAAIAVDPFYSLGFACVSYHTRGCRLPPWRREVCRRGLRDYLLKTSLFGKLEELKTPDLEARAAGFTPEVVYPV
nr:hypothetical protein [Rubrobacter aplysinae]